MNRFEELKNKKILVTGDTGIIGSWLSLWLTKIGADVIGYSNEISKGSLFELTEMEKSIDHINGDINDFKQIKKVIVEKKPEIILHLAAQSLVRKSYDTPIETFQTNVIGTANILESIKKTDVKQVIIMTSDKCYENRETEYSYKETDPIGGKDPYSASKGAAELITSAYRNSYFNSKDFTDHQKNIASVRSGNIIGGGDWAEDRIVPDCVRSLISNKEIIIRNPYSVRPWQFVLEPISGIFCLLNKIIKEPNTYSTAWNFGPEIIGKKISVKELVEKVIDRWGKGSWKNTLKENEPHEAKMLMLDSTKAMSNLDWKPVYSADIAIEKTIDWYKMYSKNEDMREFSLKQILEYENMAKEKGIIWAN